MIRRLVFLLFPTGAALAGELRDIRGPVALGGETPFVYSGLLLLLLALWWWRKRRRRPRPIPAEAAEPPRQTDPLAALTREFQAGALDAQTALGRLDDLLRRALQDRAGLPATRLTNAEILARLHDPALPPLLALLEQVKFAGGGADAEVTRIALARAADLLRRLPAP